MINFFTSDTHFNQKRTFELSKRNMYFKDVHEATEAMVERWNSVVKPEDTVLHLGDFGDFEIAPRLNGSIILLYGNYEREGKCTPTEQQKEYFSKIHTEKLIPLLNSRENKNMPKCMFATHEPENILDSKKLGFYIFGHIHEKQKVKRHGLNVGVDVNNFTPVDMETIEFYHNAIENIYDQNCFDNF